MKTGYKEALISSESKQHKNKYMYDIFPVKINKKLCIVSLFFYLRYLSYKVGFLYNNNFI